MTMGAFWLGHSGVRSGMSKIRDPLGRRRRCGLSLSRSDGTFWGRPSAGGGAPTHAGESITISPTVKFSRSIEQDLAVGVLPQCRAEGLEIRDLYVCMH